MSASPPRKFDLNFLARTDSLFSDFAPYVPSINDLGTVAFQASLAGKKSNAFTKGGGEGVAQYHCDPSIVRAVCSHPDINSQGDLVLYVELKTGEYAVMLIQSGRTEMLASAPEQFRSIGPLGPTMNDRAAVAFRAESLSGLEGIYLAEKGGVRIVTSGGGIFRKFQGLPVVNREGDVVFRADLNNGGQGVYKDCGGTIQQIIETGDEFVELGLFPTINNRDQVAFVAKLRDGTQGVFVATQGKSNKVMDSADGFESFRGALINDQGLVVFYATPTGGKLGIFSGEKGNVTEITGIGRPFAGSTVSGFALNPVSVNEAGQFVFRVTLVDGGQFIVRADPA